MTEHRLTRLDALAYIMAGDVIFTLQGLKARFTYKLSDSKPSATGNRIQWAYVLSGPDRKSDWTYIGFINLGNPLHQLKAGVNGRPDTDSFRALAWYIARASKAAADGDWRLVDQVEFWYPGACRVCGRLLTTPESLAIGVGPTCARQS